MKHAATWLGDICIALLFTMLAWWLRQMGYPLCPGDEAVWLQISRTLDAGQAWPVSGPGFMLAVQTLGEQLGRPTSEAIGLWGIGSVFGAVLVMLRVYRQLEPLRPWVICTSLAMSTYFLAPLLESRPQQWGQVLVLLGSWLCWRWLHARGGWSFFVVLLLTAYLHILSHAVLLAVCIGLMLGDVLLGQVRTPARQQRHLVVWLALLLSFGVYLLPAGPYARMLLDIHQHHLAKFSLFVPIACSLAGMALLPFFLSAAGPAYSLKHQTPLARSGPTPGPRHADVDGSGGTGLGRTSGPAASRGLAALRWLGRQLCAVPVGQPEHRVRLHRRLAGLPAPAV